MLTIKSIVVTEFYQNCRIIENEASQSCIIIDPGGDPEKIIGALSDGYDIDEIWLTHSHIDHIGGLKEIINKAPQSDVTVIGSRYEEIMRSRLSDQARMLGLNPNAYEDISEPTKYWEELGATIDWKNSNWNILFTPGHSPGHYSFYSGNQTYLYNGKMMESPILIAGDCLFKESVGRTDLPGGDWTILERSIKNILMQLPDNTFVCSGHGPETTIGHEKKYNPFISMTG